METEAFARALYQALLAEGASAFLVGDDDLSRVRVSGEVDLRAVAARVAAAPPRRTRRLSPLDEPPAWLRPYP